MEPCPRTLPLPAALRARLLRFLEEKAFKRVGGLFERFNRALRALERHASIARRLRDDGWVLVDHAIPNYAGTAA